MLKIALIVYKTHLKKPVMFIIMLLHGLYCNYLSANSSEYNLNIIMEESKEVNLHTAQALMRSVQPENSE